jgi:hypothetical protein
MRVNCALLCDAVTIREGLLHILGGGVTSVSQPEYPSGLQIMVALRISLSPDEVVKPHSFTLSLKDKTGETLIASGQIKAAESAEKTIDPDLGGSLALPFSLSEVQIPRPGTYSIVVSFGTDRIELPFKAEELNLQLSAELES